ncbi:MAG: Positive regulator of CheA protein activity (CheW) [Candidatus Ozemobacter sibiricus]|jgi:purine-binding chemotaxis protein CheW|uniref:Positive regulator of CheA protein activity (CheW) n=1 Tax=Candidatus Ozemobacter sibiricus TaxID=2268124 RepID=A0A367ZLD6_9BACT|nr:MAG: Positive regulator of CheA protein activity (CheW) [Candidatus Ozemobacter sibiricus]
MVKKAQIKQEVQVVGFYLGNDEYAITIAKVREIQSMTEIRKVPKAPKFVEGVINLRGRILPIIDLRKRFELPPAVDPAQAKILIVEFNRNHVGLVVDNVSEVIRLYSDQIEKTPDIFSLSIDSRYISGVAKLDDRLIILLDVEKLLSFEEQNALAGFKS